MVYALYQLSMIYLRRFMHCTYFLYLTYSSSFFVHMASPLEPFLPKRGLGKQIGWFELTFIVRKLGIGDFGGTLGEVLNFWQHYVINYIKTLPGCSRCYRTFLQEI